MSIANEFELFDVEVHVFKHDGTYDVQDWSRSDIEEAHEYAIETAYCEDVVKTVFRDSEAENDVLALNTEFFERLAQGQYRAKRSGEVITFKCEA